MLIAVIAVVVLFFVAALQRLRHKRRRHTSTYISGREELGSRVLIEELARQYHLAGPYGREGDFPAQHVGDLLLRQNIGVDDYLSLLQLLEM